MEADEVAALHEDDWNWANEGNPDVRFKWREKLVVFHPTFSFGTTMIRGQRPLTASTTAYWEIEACTDIYGTSIQFGVGREGAMSRVPMLFGHIMGIEEGSYGLSHTGEIHTGGISAQFGTQFSTRRPRVGILFKGPARTISYYENGRLMGTPFAQIDLSQPLYPLLSSTAQQSVFRLGVQRYRSDAPTLQSLTTERIFNLIIRKCAMEIVVSEEEEEDEEGEGDEEKQLQAVKDAINELSLPRHLNAKLKLMRTERRFRRSQLTQRLPLGRRNCPLLKSRLERDRGDLLRRFVRTFYGL